jgi:hypothetical protein
MAVMVLAGIISVSANDETYTYTTGDGTWITENIERLYQSTNFSFLHKKNSSTSNIATTYAELRVYASHSMEVFPIIPGKTITAIEVTTASTSYATAMGNATILAGTNSGTAASITGIATVNGSVTTFNLSGVVGCEYVKLTLAAQSRTLSWKVTYTTSGGTPTVATPTFDPAAGTYTSTQNVTISTTTADASIYYTTNGDEPTELSTPYTVPVEISSTTTLKAKAYKAGMDPSATATAAYTINPTPTITVTEVDVPAMSSVVPNIDTEIINITGTNLTGEITLTIDAIDGFDATVFGVSTPTLPSTGGVATISFAPGAPGVYAATLKINSAGAAEVTRTLNGTATLKTPEATDATGVSPTGFTANWEIVEGATSYELSVYKKNSGGTTATDLFFSEYLEGSSNNKALEIYNGTGASVDLSQYKVELYSNGSASVGNMLSMTGILNHGEVYVIYNSSANAAIQAVGDVSSTVTYFNGDDAIVLKKGETIIDVIGRVGEDPGTEWTAAGGYSTLDKTLVRKSSVTGGVTVNPESGFPTLATEWDVYSQDYTDNLGSHTMSGAGSSLLPIDGSPFTIISGTEKGITGLLSDTHYFYTVIAKYGSYSSLVSNEIEVVTSRHTGIEQSEILNNIYVLNDKVMFNSAAGEIVEIYNSVGQRVVNTISVEGLNSFSIDAKGVLLVKVGERIGKVIL